MKASTVLQIAYLVSQESKCCSWKVGAVIEKNGRIISTGYNGSPAGGVNCCDYAAEQGWLLNKPKHAIIQGHKPECVSFGSTDVSNLSTLCFKIIDVPPNAITSNSNPAVKLLTCIKF